MCTNAKSSTQITKYLIVLTTLKPVFVLYMYSLQKYMCSFARTLWLTIFTYSQTFSVFIRILFDDRPLYLSLQVPETRRIFFVFFAPNNKKVCKLFLCTNFNKIWYTSSATLIPTSPQNLV